MEEQKENAGINCKTYVAAGAINIEHIENVQNLYPGSPDLFDALLGGRRREEERSQEDDGLIRFVFDDREREKVRNGLQNCQDTSQVAAFAKLLWENEIIKYDILRSADFHRAIIPLLNFETTETAIKQAITKQVK